MSCYYLILVVILPAVIGGKCKEPKGDDGDTNIAGCLVLTCKGGVWRPSMNPNVCCYNGEAFQFGSTITTVKTADNCVTTTMECEHDGIKTKIVQNRDKRGCSRPASRKHARELKCLLKKHMAESGHSGCSEDVQTPDKTSPSSSEENVSGILITGGEGSESVATELFIVETGQLCTLPSLPSPRFAHSLDMMNNMPVVCGGFQDKINDDVHTHSCLNFSPMTECGSWHNFTTLQHKYGFDSHPTWLSKHGLVLFGSNYDNDLELLPFSAESQFLEFDQTKRVFEMGSGACGFADGDSFILTGHTIYGHGNNVERFSLEMFDKPGHCSWSDNKDCCQWGSHQDYQRCKLVKASVEKLPDLQQTRGKHACGIYRDKTDSKVFMVAGGWDAYVNHLSSTEILVEGASAWIYTTPLPRTLHHVASVNLDNKIFLIGGWYEYGKASDEILTFDGEDWEVAGHLLIPRADMAATKIDASSLRAFC